MKPAVKWTLIAGIVCALGAPLVGFIFTVFGMVGAFHDLGDAGIADPKILSAHIGTVLYATFVGLIVGAIGLVIVIVATILHLATKTARPTPTR
jgi:biopolymer transport protein ExbB/TolQ